MARVTLLVMKPIVSEVKGFLNGNSPDRWFGVVTADDSALLNWSPLLTN